LDKVPFIFHVNWKDTVTEVFSVKIDGHEVFQTTKLDEAEKRFFDCSDHKHTRHRRELSSNTRWTMYTIDFSVINN
jgi:hypothetical protein